jgi:hypothetical protein
MKTRRLKNEGQKEFADNADLGYTYKISIQNAAYEYHRNNLFRFLSDSKIFNKAKALGRVKAEAEKFHEEIKGFHTPFHHFFHTIYEHRRWNTTGTQRGRSFLC